MSVFYFAVSSHLQLTNIKTLVFFPVNSKVKNRLKLYQFKTLRGHIIKTVMLVYPGLSILSHGVLHIHTWNL